MQGRNLLSSGSNLSTAFVLTISLFALWGLGQRLYDTLMPQFAQVFELHGFALAMTQSVYGIVYFFGAIPAALYARRFGYKAAIIFGLGSLGVGAFVLYPAAEMRAYPYYLFAAAVMSCGWILLEVAANPLAGRLGTVATSVRRLNIAQSLFPLGALVGVYAGRWILAANLALPAKRYTYSIAHPYIVIGTAVLLLAFWIDSTRFPSVASERVAGVRGVAAELRTLLSRRLFVFGIVAQFFCVMALAGTWSLSGSLIEAAFPHTSWANGADIFVWSLTVFAAGRFVGSALMYRFEPDHVLAAFAGGGLILAAIAICSGGPFGAITIVASSFFLSITWPTVMGIAIRGLGPLMKLGTALICMGGAVGGVAYQVLNVVWLFPNVHIAMVVPAISYAVVFAFAVSGEKIFTTAYDAISRTGRSLKARGAAGCDR